MSELYVDGEFNLEELTDSSSHLVDPEHIAVLHLKLWVPLRYPVVGRIKLLIGDVRQIQYEGVADVGVQTECLLFL